MNEKSILTYQLNKPEFNLVKQIFNSNDFEVSTFSGSEKETNLIPSCCAVFIGINPTESAVKFQELINTFHGCPVFLILREENFEHLMLAFQNKVEDVFLGELAEHNIEMAAIKIKLFQNDIKQGLPKAEIIDLFSSPLNISSGGQLLFALNNYLENFEAVKKVGIIEFESNGFHSRGSINESLDLSTLRDKNLSEKFIGEVFTLEKGNISTFATPIYEKDGFYHWLIIELEKDELDYILNDLLFRFLENVYLFKKTKESERTLEVLAATDDVTGLYNQRRLSEDLEQAIIEHERLHDTFSIMFIDVDYFKEVNDNYGHLIGSKILTDLGQLLAEVLRKSDHIYRYGGDEFVVIMPVINVNKVHEVAVRVLNEIKNHSFKIGIDEYYEMSVSIGLAEYPTDAKSSADIIQFADEMMYKSKNSGRGKVFHLKEVEDVDTSSK